MNDLPHMPDDGRAEQLQRDGLVLGVVLASLLNGMQFSPFLKYAFLPMHLMSSAIFGPNAFVSGYVTSLFVSSVTIALSGIPAAIYERMSGRTQSDAASLAIWFACAAVLSFPALLGAAGIL